MKTRMMLLACAVLVFASLSFGKTITGTVSDSGCGLKHATASAGAATCVEHCVSSGKTYVLVSKGKIYTVDAQDKFKGLGGKSVTVTGTVTGTSITVTSVAEKTS